MRHFPRATTCRRLHIEPLEDRRLLAMFTVDTNLDTVDENDGLLSLREAVAAANHNTEADEITFDFGHTGPETILLTQGEIEILDSLTITGPGADLLTVDASGSDPTPEEDNGDGSRVFVADSYFGNTSNDAVLSFSGMTLTGGDTDGTGGAVYAYDVIGLALFEVVIKENHAVGPTPLFQQFPVFTDPASQGGGGGVAVGRANLSIIDSVVSHNRTKFNGGGVHFSGDGDVTIIRSNIEHNAAEDATYSFPISFSGGGGMFVFSSRSLVVQDSSISYNEAVRGTGIYGNLYQHLATQVETQTFQSTKIVGNTTSSLVLDSLPGEAVYFQMTDGRAFSIHDSLIAQNDGGAILLFHHRPGNHVTIQNTSIANNGGFAYAAYLAAGEYLPTAIRSSTIVGNGAGMSFISNVTSVRHSVVAHNGPGDDLNGFGTPLLANNFIGYSDTLTETGLATPDANGNFIGGPVGGAIDPLLDSLKYNGGQTRTMRPLAN
ncbi:MAG: right-handed parallel beta-helix repeat-containing protein, partial [Aeoliella sp.]